MTVLIVLSALNLCFLVVLALFSVNLVRGVKRSLLSFITPLDEKTPSPLEKSVQGISKIFATEVTQSVSGMLMGKASQASQLLNKVADETTMNSSPLLGLLASLSPSLRKSLVRNQAVVGLLGNLGGGIFGKGGNHKTEEVTAPKFKF